MPILNLEFLSPRIWLPSGSIPCSVTLEVLLAAALSGTMVAPKEISLGTLDFFPLFLVCWLYQ